MEHPHIMLNRRALHISIKEILLEQLSATVGEKRGGYNDDDHYVEMSTTRKSGRTFTKYLHTLATEVSRKTRLGQYLQLFALILPGSVEPPCSLFLSSSMFPIAGSISLELSQKPR